ncbi:MAG: GNAT family N-acetyltransferase [Sulfolobales archaeon]
MSESTLRVVEVDSLDHLAALSIAKLIEEEMGGWQSHYAMACFKQGYCRGLVVLSDALLGASLFYSLDLEPRYRMGVIYYVVVKREYRGRGIGLVLVSSAEYLLETEGSDIVVATTRADNYRSRRLFGSLGYEEVPLHSIEESYGDLFTKLTCSYEDDVALVKSIRVSFAELIKAFRFRHNKDRIERLWYSLCYRPWRELRSYKKRE